MHILPALPQPLRLLSIAFRRFLPWYFGAQPAAIARAYLAYSSAFLRVFSFIFLLKTLFSPWKGIADVYPENMMQLGKVFQVWTLNCTARIVGAIVRFITICIGICVQVALFALFASMLLIWLSFPILAFGGVSILFHTLQASVV